MRYLNALNKIPGVGSQKIQMLLDFFGSAEKAWHGSVSEMEQAGLSSNLAARIDAERPHIEPDQEWSELERREIRMLTRQDSAYPRLLGEIPNPPYIIYVRGSVEALNSQPGIAVVGSRKFSRYGEQVAYSFSHELSRAGVTVVSGLALGIDAIAHRAALDAGGRTIAVLGSSLEDEQIGPRTNFDLARNLLLSGGAILSEYPLGTPSQPQNFPARNRIMAGMTLGTLVVEAAEGSGSLITANLAVEFDREVFAVPGSIFSPSSQGTNRLIRSGAKMALGVADILEELRLERRALAEEAKRALPENPEEEKLLKVLSSEPLHVDKIIQMTKLKTSAALSLLTMMEMKGMVRNVGGQNYIII